MPLSRFSIGYKNINLDVLQFDNILTDVQFGIRSGLSTVDAIFVYQSIYQSIINRILCKNKRLYCCFVGYQKAFDSVDRTKLWKKYSIQAYGERC